MKRFNTTAVCIPSKHYMVDLSERVREIKKLIDAGEYFTINRARQYGKTTTLAALQDVLFKDYEVLSLSFEGIGSAGFETEQSFVKAFCRKIQREYRNGLVMPEIVREHIKDFLSRREEQAELDELFDALLEWCSASEKPIVMIIDEVDSASNNQVFLDFLGQLRDNYINRNIKGTSTFQSVILAGVTNVKHLQDKIRDEEQHKFNSPWNIAADFNIDMSLSEDGIRGMLNEYEADHHTGMNVVMMAKEIRRVTNGYPFLVSRICQLIDEQLVPSRFDNLSDAWTQFGFDEAIKMILSEQNSLFESLMGKLTNYPELKNQLRRILLRGESFGWLPYDPAQQQLHMYGFIRNNHNTVAIANEIFEMLLYVHFIGESQQNNALKQSATEIKSIFVEEDGWLNVPKIMDHFIKTHNQIHGENTEKFLEAEARERFITYVAAIINGTGTYSVEEQTRNQRRMDLVIHYLGRRYIIEMKIWRGERYNEEGEKQISDYLDYWGLHTGYLLSFSFTQSKKPGVERIQLGDKVLYEGIV